jgi:hypothetical protein
MPRRLPAAPAQLSGIRGSMVQRKLKPSADPTPDRMMGAPHRSERRERRSPLSVLLKICGFSTSGRIFSEVVSTRNISRSGCCVRLRTQPLERAALAVQIIPHEGHLPAGGRPLLYQVAWLEQQGHSWDVGLFSLGNADLLQVAFEPFTP